MLFQFRLAAALPPWLFADQLRTFMQMYSPEILLWMTIGIYAVFSAVTRGLLAHAEAAWKACELVRTSGVDPRKIAGPWTWVSYYTFEDYLQNIGYSAGADMISDFFYRWLPERESQANFTIADFPPKTQDTWRVVAEVPFRGILLRSKRVYAYQKIP